MFHTHIFRLLLITIINSVDIAIISITRFLLTYNCEILPGISFIFEDRADASYLKNKSEITLCALWLYLHRASHRSAQHSLRDWRFLAAIFFYYDASMKNIKPFNVIDDFYIVSAILLATEKKRDSRKPTA